MTLARLDPQEGGRRASRRPGRSPARDPEARPFWSSLQDAVEGLIYAVRHERSLKIHFLMGVTALLLCSFLGVRGWELLAVLFAISLVLVAEMFNTCVETVINLLTTSHHPLAKIAKDVGAGAVLVACVNALAVAWVVLVPALQAGLPSLGQGMAARPLEALGLVAVLVLVFVLMGKAVSQKGPFSRAGLVVGHAALAFGASTASVLVTREAGFSLLALPLAGLAASGKVEVGRHRWPEVLGGALLGLLLSLAFVHLLEAVAGPVVTGGS